MKTCKTYIILILLVFSVNLMGQQELLVEPLPAKDTPLGYDRDTLVAWIENILHGGGGKIDTNSITFTGNREAFGRFYNDTLIGFERGLIISNGRVENAEGDNDKGYASDEFWPIDTVSLDPSVQHGDEDLLGLYKAIFGGLNPAFRDTSIAYTGDAAAIEFYYYPYGDLITMDYVFGSEEYPYYKQPSTYDPDLTGFPNSTQQIFDLFAISIKAGNGFENLAQLDIHSPTGPVPPYQKWVNVYNVNASSNSSYYQLNEINPPFNPGLGTQFDALTKTAGDLGPTMIKAKDLTPCAKQKIKIVIEDFYYRGPNEQTTGFVNNSAVFLNENSFKSVIQLNNAIISNYDVDFEYHNPNLPGMVVDGDCNYINGTVTLVQDSMKIDYFIPFQIKQDQFRDKVEVAYEDGTVITNDTIVIPHGAKEVKFTIKAINLTDDINTDVYFKFKNDPCDPGFMNQWQGSFGFRLYKNKPITFTIAPKVYEAFCKETVELTVTDVTEDGVGPLFYRWNNDVMPNDTINYQVQASPDSVKVTVNDYCNNLDSVFVRINNKQVPLQNITPPFLCGPGQFIDVDIKPDSVSAPADFTYESVEWFKKSTGALLGQATGNTVRVFYDDLVGPNDWICSFKITDCCGGVTEGEFTVNQSEMSLGDDVWICNGESITLTANASGSDYKWYESGNPGVTLANDLSVTVSPSVTTEYVFSMTDNCSEFQDDTIAVNVDQFVPAIAIDTVSAEICLGESITLTANDAESWIWTPGNETTQSITVTPDSEGNYTYTLTASSLYCIDKVATADFTVFPNPSVDLIVDPGSDACTGEPITFDYSDIVTNETFAWDFDDGGTSGESDPVHTYINSGTYNVTLHVDKYICDSDTAFDLIVNPLPEPDFEADVTEACGQVDVNFDDMSQEIFPGATYEWSFGDGSIDNTNGNTSHVYDSAGLYTVGLTIYNTARCSQSNIKYNYISVNPNPDADFEANPWITTMDNPVIQYVDMSTSDSTITDWEWDLGDGTISYDENPVHNYTVANDYEILLRVLTENGCWDTITHKVAISQNIQLFIPNAFTPNGDGENDDFEIKGTPITDFNLYIYDRWGSIIWTTHDFETHWDGTTRNGDPVNSGSYVYVIKGTDYKLEEVFYQGVVTVIR